MKTYGVVKGEWLILGVRESIFEEKNTSILYTDEKQRFTEVNHVAQSLAIGDLAWDRPQFLIFLNSPWHELGRNDYFYSCFGRGFQFYCWFWWFLVTKWERQKSSFGAKRGKSIRSEIALHNHLKDHFPWGNIYLYRLLWHWREGGPQNDSVSTLFRLFCDDGNVVFTVLIE